MTGSNIIQSGDHAFHAASCSDPGTIILAENNWWGTADEAEIEALIYDNTDDASAPIVDYSPWAAGPFGCECEGFGDLNLDGGINPVDVVLIVNYVYKNFDSIVQLSQLCPATNGDYNCDNQINPVDAVYYVNYVYKAIGTGPCQPCAP